MKRLISQHWGWRTIRGYMIIPWTIFGLVGLGCFITFMRQENTSKADIPLCLFGSILIGTLGGGVLNLVVFGISVYFYEPLLYAMNTKEAVSSEMLEAYNNLFYLICSKIQEGGSLMWNAYLSHPVAFVMLLVLGVWVVRTILKTIFK